MRSLAVVVGFVMPILAGAETSTLADGTPVQRGAEFVSAPVLPERLEVDARLRPRVATWQPGDPITEVPRGFFSGAPLPVPTPVNPVAGGLDPLASKQRAFDALREARAFSDLVVNRPGQGNTGISPADPTGDVGRDHYIQAINGSSGALYVIYNKADGSIAAGPFSMEGLGTGVCASGFGDSVVMYDELADRWVLTEFTTTAGRSLCFYVSATNNPVSTTWYRYTFTMPSFPDYPRYGVWPDGYYAGTNEGSGARPLYVFERAKMLTGDAATFQRLTTPRLAGFGFETILAADITGSTLPPDGAPGLFMRHRDDEAHNAGSNNPAADFVDLYSLKVDFATPANTVLTGPTAIEVNEFDSNLVNLSTFNVFPQPSGQRVDSVREVIMQRLGYRRFATHEALIANWVTDVDGADTGGVRWVEFRRTGGLSSPWVKFQEGTYAPADDGGPADRWMGALALDSSGNVGLGYSVVRQNPAIPLSLRYTGRRATDPLGVMTQPETTIVSGGGSVGGNRWGDYFDMSVDPIDTCTFWFTGGYAPTSAWATQIAAFRFPECGEPSFSLNATLPEQAVCAISTVQLPRLSLDLAVNNGFTGDADVGFSAPLPNGVTALFDPSTVALPGQSQLRMTVANTTAPGLYALTVRAVSNRQQRELPLSLRVATANTPAATLAAPAANAINIARRPVFSWTTSPQAASYTIEASLSPSFGTLLFSGTVGGGGNSFQPNNDLPANSLIYWRVRGSNPCGQGADSAVSSFRTVPGPGQCPINQATRVLFDDTIENGVNGWALEGLNPWAISNARANSPTRSWKGLTPATTSIQSASPPPTAIPSLARSASFRFYHWRAMEPNSTTGCYDGGSVLAAVNGGAFGVIPAAQILLNGASQRPLGGSNGLAWCGSAGWEEVVVDATPYIGQNVQFRFRTISDTSNGQEGWYIDDVQTLACFDDLIFANGFEN
jgi:hypothetical protein